MKKEIQSREWLLHRLSYGIKALPNVAPEDRKDCAMDLCRDLMDWACFDEDVAHQEKLDKLPTAAELWPELVKPQ